MVKHSELTLAIEAAISGGSLSLLRSGEEIDNWIGRSAVAQAEHLLADVDLILTRNGLSVRDIGLIAVSSGPGSFTGIRIGIATARGLAAGLGVEMASESALTAIASQYEGYTHLVVAVPAGRSTVCYQLFETNNGAPVPKREPSTAAESEFLQLIRNDPDTRFILHQDLFEKSGTETNVADFGRNVAFAIARTTLADPLPKKDPLFISKNL